jgi:hypothetical protein
MLFSIIISPETSVLNTWTSVDRFQKTRSDLVSFFVVQASTDDYNKCLQAMMDARAVWQAVRIISSLLVILFGFLLFSQEESVVQTWISSSVVVVSATVMDLRKSIQNLELFIPVDFDSEEPSLMLSL